MPYIGVSPQFGVRRKHTYTATASQTSFSGAGAEGATLSYTDSNFVDVYQNGVKLGDADYTSTSGTAIVLDQGASVGDLVEIIVFDAFSAADTVSKADGGTFDGTVTLSGGVSGDTTFTGAITGTTATLSTADNTAQLTLKSTDADANAGPLLDMKRDSSSPADGDFLGQLNFIAENDASQEVTYAQITGRTVDVTDGTEDGRIAIKTMRNGSSRAALDFNSGETVFNDDGDDVNFRVESNDSDMMFFIDAGNNMVGIGTDSPHDLLTVKGLSGASTDISFAGGDNTNEVRLFFGGSSSPFNGAIQYLPNNDYMTFKTAGVERQRIFNTGAFALNLTHNPVSDSGNTTGGHYFTANSYTAFSKNGGVVSYFNRTYSDGNIVAFRQDGTDEGFISISGNTTSYGAFSGAHWSRLSDNSKPTILRGTIIETIDEMCDWYQVKFEVDGMTKKVSYVLKDNEKVGDTITYTYKQDDVDDADYQATIIKEDDNKHTKCKISDTADSTRVYGVYTAWDDDDDTVNDMHVTACGTHIVRINKDVTVKGGDLLSSNGDGTAKVQDDDIIRSKTIGKVLTNIKQETYSDGSYTVPCALYCG